MSETRRSIRLMKKEPVEAGGLVTVVFEDDTFAHQPCKKKGRNGRASQVHRIRPPNKAPQLEVARPADDAKWERTVDEFFGGRLRDDRNVKLRTAVRQAQFSEAAG